MKTAALPKVSLAKALIFASARHSTSGIELSTAGGDRRSNLCGFSDVVVGILGRKIRRHPTFEISAVRMRGREKLVEKMDPGIPAFADPRGTWTRLASELQNSSGTRAHERRSAAPRCTEHLFVSGRLTSSSQRGTRRLPRIARVGNRLLSHALPPSLRPSVPPSLWMNEQHPLCGKASAILDMKMMKAQAQAQAQAQPGPAQPTHPRRSSRWPPPPWHPVRVLRAPKTSETNPPPPPVPPQPPPVTLRVLESRRPAIDLSLAESNSRPRAKSAALDGVRDPHPAAEILAANEVPAWLRSSPDRVRAGKKERGGFFLQSFGMLGMHRSCLVVLASCPAHGPSVGQTLCRP